MMRRLGVLVAALLSGAAPAWAQSSPTARPTKVEPIARSMEQLLNDGYEITAMNAGMAGFGFVLRKDKSWILCTMGIEGTPPHAQNTSDCGKLN